MIKRIMTFLAAWVFLLGLCACGQSTSGQADSVGQATWEEQYDLGIRYLSEGNYEEAIIAFTAAIEIDPKQAPAYVGRADAYVLSGETEANLTSAQMDYEKAIELDETCVNAYLGLANVYVCRGEYDRAIEILKTGFEAIQNGELAQKIDELQTMVSTAQGNMAEKELKEITKEIDISFTVDDIELGVTSIETAINNYIDYPGARRGYSHGNTSKDEATSVGAWFGHNRRENYPMREGYKERELAFGFGSTHGIITGITICTDDFVCFGSIKIGDEKGKLLSLFGLQDLIEKLAQNSDTTYYECATENEHALSISLEAWGDDGSHLSYLENGSMILTYYESENMVEIQIKDNKVYSIYMNKDSVYLYVISTME